MSLQGVPSLNGELSEVNPGMMKMRPSWSQRIAQEGWPKGGWKAVTSKNNKRMFPSVLSFLIHKNKWDRFLRPQSTVAEEVISLGWSYGKVKVGRDFLKAVWSNSAQAGPLRAGVQCYVITLQQKEKWWSPRQSSFLETEAMLCFVLFSLGRNGCHATCSNVWRGCAEQTWKKWQKRSEFVKNKAHLPL